MQFASSVGKYEQVMRAEVIPNRFLIHFMHHHTQQKRKMEIGIFLRKIFFWYQDDIPKQMKKKQAIVNICCCLVGDMVDTTHAHLFRVHRHVKAK
jgi:hypothetical protein